MFEATSGQFKGPWALARILAVIYSICIVPIRTSLMLAKIGTGVIESTWIIRRPLRTLACHAYSNLPDTKFLSFYWFVGLLVCWTLGLLDSWFVGNNSLPWVASNRQLTLWFGGHLC